MLLDGDLGAAFQAGQQRWHNLQNCRKMISTTTIWRQHDNECSHNLMRVSPHNMPDHHLQHELAVISCHDYPLTSKLLTVGVDKCMIIYQKFQANPIKSAFWVNRDGTMCAPERWLNAQSQQVKSWCHASLQEVAHRDPLQLGSPCLPAQYLFLLQ